MLCFVFSLSFLQEHFLLQLYKRSPKKKKNLNYKAQTLNTINSSKALNADRNEIVKKNNVLNVRVRLVENGIETIKPRLKKTTNISYFSAMVEQPS